MEIVTSVLFLLFINLSVAAQNDKKYLVIEPDSTYFKIHTLKSKKSPFENVEITIINVIGDECRRRKGECLTSIYYTPIEFEGDFLVTLSVLPSNVNQKTEWRKLIKMDSIKDKILQYDTIIKFAHNEIMNCKRKLISDGVSFWINQNYDIVPIVKKGENYYTTEQNVMTNFYEVVSKPNFFPVENNSATICYNAQKYSKEFILSAGKKVILLDNFGKSQLQLEYSLRDRLYLTSFLRDKKLFWFWHYPMDLIDFGCADGLSEFIYSLDKGIVGATFECYMKELLKKAELADATDVPMFSILEH